MSVEKRAVGRAAVTVAIGVVGALLLSGCGAQLARMVHGSESDAVISVAPNPEDVAEPDTPITVTASNGRLTHVSVMGPKGEIPGQLDPSATSWVSTRSTLAFNSEYQIQASAVDEYGLEATLSDSVRTLKPAKTFETHVTNIAERDTIGVGMPLRVEFSTPIRDRAKVEKHLKLYASKPLRGAWSWNSDYTEASFRPQKFWPASTKYALRADLYGVEGAKSVYGEKNLSFTWQTGSSMVITVDADTLQATVVRDGEKLRTIPVTTGKSGFATRSGTVAIMSKEGTVRMEDPSLRGTGEHYDLMVNYSMRIRPTGEFMHAAPWSTGSQGYSRVSHGCIGMSTGNASWLYSMVTVGDPVIVKNTGRAQELGNGITEFSVPWKQWLKRSATGLVPVGPGGGIAAAKIKKVAGKKKAT